VHLTGFYKAKYYNVFVTNIFSVENAIPYLSHQIASQISIQQVTLSKWY